VFLTVFTDKEFLSDFAVAAALGDQAQHFLLTPGKSIQRVS
jgi:hypothetical protein